MQQVGFQLPDELFQALYTSNMMKTHQGNLSKTGRAIFQLYLEQVEGYRFPEFEPMKCGRPRKVKIKKRDK